MATNRNKQTIARTLQNRLFERRSSFFFKAVKAFLSIEGLPGNFAIFFKIYNENWKLIKNLITTYEIDNLCYVVYITVFFLYNVFPAVNLAQ